MELDIDNQSNEHSSWFDRNVNYVLCNMIFELSYKWYHVTNLIMQLVVEGTRASKLIPSKSLNRFIELDKRVKR